LLDQVETSGGSLLDRELETLGFDHAVLSARLLAHWGLPAGLCASVSIPPNETRIAELSPGERTLPQILHLAELLVRLIEQPHGSALGELTTIGGRYCSLTGAELEPLVQALEQKVAGLASVLALELPAGQSYVDLLVAAQQRMADESIGVVAGLAAPSGEGELLSLAGQLRSELAAACGRPLAAAPKASMISPEVAATERHSTSGERTRAALDANYLDRAPTKANLVTAEYRSPPSHGMTGVVADASLLSRVSAAVQRCRQTRRPVSLALLEIDRFSDVLLELGPAGMAEVTHWLRVALADWTGQRAGATLVSDSCLAIVWEDCPRNEAVQMARHVLAAVKPWSGAEFVLRSDLTLSFGLATIEFPPKNFPSQELLDAAQRCLGGAQLSGGDTVKSIAF
jgi:GGDEF domain-containing protein